ncbi:phosphatidylinositide phosphatase [Galdieria sulphuraria]|uniref:Phosphatidylinositide phosphatase n=1 Tax=Galdieria sulphuraria TaxID=130081 RepID=M2Y873_GALSU|nr:phosphatidylinositide phosphatase [Galdieria sulphuraria]EME32039.1 phosphatidylinositide phosphatase [Galdieria sulphuraria]|eukprot:XP_005708559.1 phosphatidylinositide phosphatase [Galdieria sulphuraria]
MLVERERLRVTDDWIVIDSLNSSTTSATSHASLFLCRNTGRIFEKQERPAIEKSPQVDCIIFGIVGIVQLLCNNYLVYIKNREWIGKLLQHDIYKVTQLEWIPIKRLDVEDDYGAFNKNMKRNQLYLLSLLQTVFSQTNFYYSTTFMLTRRLQTIYSSPIDDQVKPLCLSADKRFFWNQHIAKSLVENKLYSWVVPLISGFVRCEVFSMGSNVVRYILISRISCERAGPRYHCRGSDGTGKVANFVETEQIMTYYDNVFSFVQIRGSIPVIWKQTPNLKYKPKIEIYSSRTAEEFSSINLQKEQKTEPLSPFTTIIRHFEELQKNYGPQVAVSLIDQKGSEAQLGDLYQSGTRENFPSTVVDYIAWDFHRFCKGMRFDRVYQLVQQLEPSLDIFGFYYRKLGDHSSTPSLQKGYIRTNCIDCLDRTNVLQSAIAEVILTKQLRQLQILSQEQTLKDFILVYAKFSNIWADHADAISEYYAGTGALKTDYTRTGKRSYRGIAVDGWRSLLRYWKNNFLDGYKQDAYNLLLGKVQIQRYRSKTIIPSYWDQLSWKEKWIPLLCLTAIISCIWGVFSLRNVSLKYRVVYFLTSFSILLRGLSFMISHGKHYAIQPRLATQY